MSFKPSVSSLKLIQSKGKHRVASPRAEEDAYKIFSRMAPYIAVHRGTTMVIHIPGEVMMDEKTTENVLRDVLLLKSLGVKIVLIAGRLILVVEY